MDEIGDENGHPVVSVPVGDSDDNQYQIKLKKIKRKPGLPQRVDMTGNLVAYSSTTSAEGNNILRQSNRKLSPSEFPCSQPHQQHPPGSVEARLEKLLKEYPDNERALLLAKKLKARKMSKEKNMNHTPSPRFVEGQSYERDRSLGSISRLHIQALYGSNNNKTNNTQTTHGKNPSSSSSSKAQCVSNSNIEQNDRLVDVCVNNNNNAEENIDKDSTKINKEVVASSDKLREFDLCPLSSIDGRETDTNTTTSRIGELLEDIGEKYGNVDSIGPVTREHYSTDDDYETMESKTSIELTSQNKNRGKGERESPRGSTVVKNSKNNSQLQEGAKQNNRKKYSTKVLIREENISTPKKNKSLVSRKDSSSSTTTCIMEETTIKCDIIKNAPYIVSSDTIIQKANYNNNNNNNNNIMMVQHNVSDDDEIITKEKKNNILLGKKQLFGSEADYNTVMSMLLSDTTEDAVSELLVPVGLFVDDDDKEEEKNSSNDEELGRRRDMNHDSDKNTATATATATIRFRRMCVLLGIIVLVITAIIGLGFFLGFVSSKLA